MPCHGIPCHGIPCYGMLWYGMVYHTNPWHGISNESLVFSWYTHKPLGECVYRENTNDKWDIPWYSTRQHCINYFIPCNRKYSDQQNQWDIGVAHYGKVLGCSTIEYTIPFLYSDWLYFLWHGIKFDLCLCLA